MFIKAGCKEAKRKLIRCSASFLIFFFHCRDKLGRHRPYSFLIEVSQHIHIESQINHIDLKKVNILNGEPRWFERGVTEAIYIRINQPTFNKDGGHTNCQMSMTQFWRHYQRSAILGNWVTLLIKAAVRAAENFRYAIFLCRDEKFKPSHQIQHC